MSKKEIKIVTVIGARPQFIKAATISRVIEKHNIEKKNPEVQEIIVHTGQHYDLNMSQIFFDQLKIPVPKYHLEVGSGSHGQMTGKMLVEIETVLQKEKPDWVLVYGDTNSTLAGALVAVKLHIPVGHVEAGLRSFNRRMPEEINRVVTDQISTMLFCPTETAVNNLKREGFKNILNPTNLYPACPVAPADGTGVKSLPSEMFTPWNAQPIQLGQSLSHKGASHLTGATNPINSDNPLILNVGDVMYDAFLAFKDQALKKSKILSDLELQADSYCLATVHRQENTDDTSKLFSIFSAFEELAGRECPFIIPLHPRTRQSLKNLELKVVNSPYVRLISPVDYVDMIALELCAKVILTDSGGMQKEAFFAQTPCITLRNETEWVETVEAGWNYLAGTDTRSIIKAFNSATNFDLGVPPHLFGDGNAANLILQHLISASP